MRKLLMVLLATILVASLVVGCAPEQEPQEESPFDETSPETPVDDMNDPGNLEDDSPSGNDEDLDNPPADEGSPQGSIRSIYYFS